MLTHVACGKDALATGMVTCTSGGMRNWIVRKLARDGGGVCAACMCCGQVSTLGGIARRSQKAANKRCAPFVFPLDWGGRGGSCCTAVAVVRPRFLYKSSSSLRMLTTCYKNIQSNSRVDLQENIHLPCHSTQQRRVLMDLQFFTENTPHSSGEVPNGPQKQPRLHQLDLHFISQLKRYLVQTKRATETHHQLPDTLWLWKITRVSDVRVGECVRACA